MCLRGGLYEYTRVEARPHLVRRGEESLQRQVMGYPGQSGHRPSLRGLLLGGDRVAHEDDHVVVRLVLVGEHNLARPPRVPGLLPGRVPGLLDVPFFAEILPSPGTCCTDVFTCFTVRLLRSIVFL